MPLSLMRVVARGEGWSWASADASPVMPGGGREGRPGPRRRQPPSTRTAAPITDPSRIPPSPADPGDHTTDAGMWTAAQGDCGRAGPGGGPGRGLARARRPGRRVAGRLQHPVARPCSTCICLGRTVSGSVVSGRGLRKGRGPPDDSPSAEGGLPRGGATPGWQVAHPMRHARAPPGPAKFFQVRAPTFKIPASPVLQRSNRAVTHCY